MPENDCNGNNPCGMKTRIENLEEDSRRNQATHKEFYNRFEAMGERMARNDERYTQIIQATSEIKQDVKETKSAIQAINEKPGKRWEGIVDKVIWAICAAVIAFLLAKMGLS